MNEELLAALDTIEKFAGEECASRVAAIVEDARAEFFAADYYERVPDTGMYGIDERGHWYDMEPIEFVSPSNY